MGKIRPEDLPLLLATSTPQNTEVGMCKDANGTVLWNNGATLIPLTRDTATPKVVKNLYPSNSEVVTAINSNTTPGVTSGVAMLNPPAGVKAGSQVGTSGFAQSNYSVIADSNYWVFSFYAQQVAGATGAQVVVGPGTGWNGGVTASLTYDWDNPLTVGTTYSASTPTTPLVYWIVQDVGGGVKRFSFAYKNDGTRTTFIIRFDGSAAANKSILTGFQLERIPDDGSSLLPSAYNPTGQLAPFLNQGRSGLKIVREKRLPFALTAVVSDSIWGAGTNYKMAAACLSTFGQAAAISLAGQTLETVLAAKVTNANGVNYSKALVIYNVGRNNAFLTSQQRATMTANLLADISTLGHNNFIVCGVLPRFVSSGAVGAEETNATNTANYNAIRALNDLWKITFGSRFIDLHRVLVNAYDPTSAGDVTDFGLDARPRSLTGGTNVDNLHPNDAENQVMFAAVVDLIFNL